MTVFGFGRDPSLSKFPHGALDGRHTLSLGIVQDGLDFAEQLFDRHRIAVVAGEGFGSHTRGFLRVALTVDAVAVERAARAICDVGAA